VNEESQGIREVLVEMKDWLVTKQVKVIGYYFKEKCDYPFSKEYKAEITSFSEEGVVFNLCIKNVNHSFKLGLIGAHNVSNALGVICSAIELGIDVEKVKPVLEAFKGIGRRTELIEEVNGIKVFDDYGHHPTAIGAVIDTFKMTYPDKKIYAVVEPHQISRLKLFPKEFIEALNKADESIVTKSYIGREINKHLEPVDMEAFVSHVDAGKASYIEDFDKVASVLALKVRLGDIIVVFGAGNSYKLTQQIITNLKAHV
jgi:UDP-N-acetylmuramate--alanine ligase